MNIFVGNLSFQTTEKQLEDLFTSYGVIQSVKIITDRYSGRSKGFAFVEMPDAQEAQAAIESLNNHNLENRDIVVNEAKPRENSNNFKNNRY